MQACACPVSVAWHELRWFSAMDLSRRELREVGRGGTEQAWLGWMRGRSSGLSWPPGARGGRPICWSQITHCLHKGPQDGHRVATGRPVRFAFTEEDSSWEEVALARVQIAPGRLGVWSWNCRASPLSLRQITAIPWPCSSWQEGGSQFLPCRNLMGCCDTQGEVCQ